MASTRSAFTSRRSLIGTGLGFAFAALTFGGCARAGTADHRPSTVGAEPRPLRIATPVGVFDALAAGDPAARPVLLWHGFPESSLAWAAQLPALADAGFRAVAPDLRGYSPDVRPSRISDYRLERGVDDTIMIADALGWDRFDLVGHDWGAAIGWVAAAHHGERIRSLSALAVPHLAAFSRAIRSDPAQRRASGYLAGFRRPSPEPEEKILRAGPPVLPGVPAERSATYFQRLSQPGALTAALNWYRANDFTGHDELVEIPTLLVAGDHDATVAMSGVRATADWVRGPYRLVVLPGGHNLPEQRPAEINSALLRQLRTAG